MLLDGDLEGAGDWADSLTGPLPDQPFMWLEEPQLTRARVLVARSLTREPAQTWQVLDSLKEIVERTHDTRHAIEILALRALALEAQGEPDRADAELRRSIDLARPGGFVRPFVDLGQPMQMLLCRFADQGHATEAVRRLLAAFPSQPLGSVAAASPAPAGPHSAGNLALAEPLTSRELEVLNLLRTPLSFKEIALQLHISPATVKRHSINIYAKLGVSTRWKAVARAEELGLLPRSEPWLPTGNPAPEVHPFCTLRWRCGKDVSATLKAWSSLPPDPHRHSIVPPSTRSSSRAGLIRPGRTAWRGWRSCRSIGSPAHRSPHCKAS